MISFGWPEMVNNTTAVMAKDHEATVNNLKLMLLSPRTSLFGDPYYGTELQKTIYNPNHLIIQDLVIDDIYSSIQVFMPQLDLSRRDISITHTGTNMYGKIKATNLIDHTNNLYEIRLTDSEINVG